MTLDTGKKSIGFDEAMERTYQYQHVVPAPEMPVRFDYTFQGLDSLSHVLTA